MKFIHSKKPQLPAEKVGSEGTVNTDGSANSASATRATVPWVDESPTSLLRAPLITGTLVILFFFGGFGSWAALAKIASGASAQGVVSPEGNRKTIQHLEGGIITKILVRSGDEVSADDPLIILQETQARSSVTQLEHSKHLNASKLARLLAEQSGSDTVTFPGWLLDEEEQSEEAADIIQAQRNLFITRRDVHLGRKAIANKRIDELREEIKGLQLVIRSKRSQLASLTEELKAKGKMLERGLIPKPEYLELERIRFDIEGQTAQAIADVARARQSIEETRLQIVNEDARRLDSIAEELTETRAELATISERLDAQSDILLRTVIRAPVSGTIHNALFHTRGGVIRPGEDILDIVPKEAELIIDSRISPVDIDNISVGQQARIHFLAFSQREQPQIDGIVRSISADSLVDEVSGETYYRALVEVPIEEIEKLGEDMSLNPGMPAEVLIITGERTLLNYLLEPISNSLRRSFREN